MVQKIVLVFKVNGILLMIQSLDVKNVLRYFVLVILSSQGEIKV